MDDSINQLAKQLEEGNNRNVSYDISDRRELTRDIFGYQGIFYPQSWRFYHKPISTRTVRKYSTVDETNPILLSNALDEFVKDTLMIVSFEGGKEKYIPYYNLYEHDRIAYILAVHRSSKGQSGALTSEYICSNDSCGKNNNIIIAPEMLIYKKYDNKFFKYYNEDKGIFDITLKNGNIYKYKPYTIKQSQDLRTFIKQKQNQNKDIEIGFIHLCNLLMLNYNYSNLDDLYEKYLVLSDIEFDTMKYISEKLRLDIGEGIVHKCTCGFQNTTQFNINGITTIFNHNNIADLFD